MAISKRVMISQSNYIPWKGYFDAINSVDEYIVYDEVQFTRRDWRNRNRIKTPQGVQWLTIPVEITGKYHQKISDVKVADLTWNQAHWKTIVQNYSKAPFFKLYRELFEKEFFNLGTENLSEINQKLLKKICEILEIKTVFRSSSEFELTDGKNERLLDICLKVGAKHYYSGPAAKSYLNEDVFGNAGVQVHYFDFSGYPEYPQLYGDFAHDVTVLDLLFNAGPDSKKYMKSFLAVQNG